MARDSSAPFYLFMHIPKTAGTTLRSIVDAQYARQEVLSYYNQSTTQLLDNLSAYMMVKEPAALIGHFPFGIHARLPRPSRYITFLRDPVALLYSTYLEILKGAGPIDIPDVAAEKLSFGQTLERHGEYLRDLQVSYILNIPKGGAFPDNACEQAAIRLDEYFTLVGITERFDESVLLLSKSLGWKPCIYRRQNVSAKQPWTSSENTEKLVSELTLRDQELYNQIYEKFLHQVEQQPSIFIHALEELEAANAQNDLESPFNNYQSATLVEHQLSALGEYLDGPGSYVSTR